MIIIAGHTIVDASKRDSSVQAFADMVERARRHDGCLDLSISPDSVDPERVNLFECWRDQQSLDAWRKVARSPESSQRDTRAARETHVKLYRCDKAEEPF